MRYIHLFGPNCICKGYLSRLAKEHFGDSLEVIGTGDLTRDALLDERFKTKYGHVVARGDLLPDEVMFHLFQERFHKLRGSRDLSEVTILIDGLGRDVRQIEMEVGLGMLNPGSAMALILNGTERTCRERFLDRLDRKSNGKRTDEDASDRVKALKTFAHRFGIYAKNWPKVRARLRRTEIDMPQIDAGRDIEFQVFPDVLSHMAFFMMSAQPAHSASVPLEGPLREIVRGPLPGGFVPHPSMRVSAR